MLVQFLLFGADFHHILSSEEMQILNSRLQIISGLQLYDASPANSGST